MASFCNKIQRLHDGCCCEKKELSTDDIVKMIRSYTGKSNWNDQLDIDFTMDGKIEFVDSYFTHIHDDDYLIFKYFTDPNETLLDIGANAGYSATSMWAAGGCLGVISFEPIAAYEKNLLKIQEKAAYPYDFRICGLSDTVGNCEFHTPICNGIGLSAFTMIDIDAWKENAVAWAAQCSDHMKSAYKEKMETFSIYKFKSDIRTVDSVLSEDVFLVKTDAIAAIKIDAEGHDSRVLRGCLMTIECHHPLVLIEHNSEEIASMLQSRGYVQVYRHGDKLSQNDLDKDNINNFYISTKRLDQYEQRGLYVKN